MDVEPPGLEAGEPIGDGQELLVLLQKGVLEVGAEDVMAVVDLVDDSGRLAAELPAQSDAEDLRDLVGGQPPEADLATSLEDLVDGEVAFEDEVAAVLDLGDGVEAGEVHLFALPLAELRAQDQGPVLEPLANDLGAQPIGGRWRRRDIVHGEERIILLAEADLASVQFLLDEAVAVEVIGGVKREVRRYQN